MFGSVSKKQELFDETHVEWFGVRIRRIERAWTIIHLNGETIQCFEQIIHVIHNKIDQIGFERFIWRSRLWLHRSSLRQASALLRRAASQCRRIAALDALLALALCI